MEYISEKMSLSDPQPIKWHLLETITDNFSERMKIGSGGYGTVYKGVLNGVEIAVKKLFYIPGLNDEAFKNEFRNIKKIQHKNVIQMIGYCYEIAHRDVEYEGKLVWSQVIDRAMCFEYMKGGSLARHISAESCLHDWPTTYKIISGTCEGLHHLHEGGEQKIFHLDLKPDNVLLDENFVPKIGDFGLSRLFGTSYTHEGSTMKGTVGFMPQEYIHNHKASPKTDVFSLGVIIFHMMAGVMGYGDYSDAHRHLNFSPKIQQDFIKSVNEYWKIKMESTVGYRWDETDVLGVTKCIEMAMRCVEDDQDKRPSMTEILDELKELDSKMEEMLKEDPKPPTNNYGNPLIGQLESSGSKHLTVDGSKHLEVDPALELRFPFELNKDISTYVQLTNKTDNFIAFNIITDKIKYGAQPSNGTIPPCSKVYIAITLRAQEKKPPNMRCNDTLIVQSTILDMHYGDEITDKFFEKAMPSMVVDEVVLPIIYICLLQEISDSKGLELDPALKLQMEHRAITAKRELECMIFDASAEPKPLPLLLLEHITSDFSDDKQVGHGGFAKVYKGMLENGTIAVKKIFGTVDIDEKKFTEEIRCLMKAKHKNIVRFLGYCSETQGEMLKFDGKLVLADLRQRLLCFEYLPKGSLEKQITDASRGLKWIQRYKIINGICDGLYYLHQMQIVHLDLKPENILLNDNMVPKIADFGLSRCFDDKQSRATASHMFGTMGYMAPELLCGRQITFKSDIYSLGIILIRILTGEKGYPCPDIDNVLESWRNRLGKSEVDTQLSQVGVCTQIAIDCTEWNPESRPDIHDIVARLRATKSVDDSATEIGTSGS